MLVLQTSGAGDFSGRRAVDDFASHVKRGLALSCLTVMCSLFGCAEAPKPAEPPPPRVTVQKPEEREIVDYNEYSGWTDASATVEVRSRVRGHIKDVPFTDGDMVEKDQLLFELDPRPFEADVAVAQGAVEVDKAQLEFAKNEEAREQELFVQKANTKVDVEQAVATRKTWEAKLLAATEEVNRNKLQLEYSRITAPMAGKIGRALLVKGNLVNAGGSDPLLTTIVVLDPIYVYFFVDERALQEYRQKNSQSTQRTHSKPLKEAEIPFEFGLETDAGYPHKGMLDFAENRIDSKTGTAEIRGSTPNPDAKILPGSRVRVRIPVSQPYKAVLVPDEAILSDQDQRYLLCLNDENVVIRRNVSLGRLLDDGMRVLLPAAAQGESVTPNDVVIVLGQQRARINYPVEPMNADGKPLDAAKAETASN